MGYIGYLVGFGHLEAHEENGQRLRVFISQESLCTIALAEEGTM